MTQTYKVVDQLGTTRYYKDPEHTIVHREDGPAIIQSDSQGGIQFWCIDGKFHRDGGPAVVSPLGTQQWFLSGVFHRLDGPAWITADGYQAWYVNGKLHRVDGPAVTKINGEQLWYEHGFLHREDGPAVIGKRKTYALYGKRITKAEWKQAVERAPDQLSLREVELQLGRKVTIVV